MEIGAVEGYLPIDRIKLGTDDGADVDAMKALVRHLGGLGIGLVCYNFMAGTDWIRTSIDAPERCGAKTTAFRLRDLEHARIPGRAPFSAELEPGAKRPELWKNLRHFLEEIIPVAEECGIVMAMHPDDPPLPQLLGNDRIMHDVAGFERLVELVPSPCNKITFCQGTFSEMGIDVPATIRRLGSHIAYVHFRDVVGTADDFRETWQDNGQTDMAEAMRAVPRGRLRWSRPPRPRAPDARRGRRRTWLHHARASLRVRLHTRDDARDGRTPLLAAGQCAPHDIGRTATTSTSNFRAGDKQLVMVVRAGNGREKYSR